jgi:hypothetical protein
MSSIFAISTKDSVITDMATSADALIAAGENRQVYAASWLRLSEQLNRLVISQYPAIEVKLTSLSQLITQISEAEQKLADSEIRNGEDFRDIVARYEVVYRCSEAYLQTQTTFKTATEVLTQALKKQETESQKPDYEKVKVKIEAAVATATTNKRNSLEAAKTAILDLIRERQKYRKFKIRKLREGWSKYAAVLKSTADVETGVFNQVKGVLAEMREFQEPPPEEVAQIGQEIEAQLGQAPPPAVVPNAAEAVVEEGGQEQGRVEEPAQAEEPPADATE